jgi:hypothetical protein
VNDAALRAAAIYCARLESALAEARALNDAVRVDRNNERSPIKETIRTTLETARLAASGNGGDETTRAALAELSLAAAHEELSEARQGLLECGAQLTESAKALSALLDGRRGGLPSPRAQQI